MECGITEIAFWDMTLAELVRAIESWQRIEKRKAQEKASYDYILAALIGRNVASYFAEGVSIPEISEVYSHLFQEQADTKEQEKLNAKNELSALRFKMFAKAYNDTFKKSEEVAKPNE